MLSIAGAKGSGVPIQTCPLHQAEVKAAVASLHTHPCMAQRHNKTLQTAVGVLFIPQYLRMALAGAKRSWPRPMRL